MLSNISSQNYVGYRKAATEQNNKTNTSNASNNKNGETVDSSATSSSAVNASNNDASHDQNKKLGSPEWLGYQWQELPPGKSVDLQEGDWVKLPEDLYLTALSTITFTNSAEFQVDLINYASISNPNGASSGSGLTGGASTSLSSII